MILSDRTRKSANAAAISFVSFLVAIVGCGDHTEIKSVGKTVSVKEMATHLEPPAEIPPPAAYQPRPVGELTFAKDIAPIFFQKCASCHHPGATGPFPLLTCEDVKKHSSQIVEVIQKRIMPPWSPLPGYAAFENDRGLDATEIGMIKQWTDEGEARGNDDELPAVPEFPSGWKYGTPDLVVEMQESFTVPAESEQDLYRKFVIPVPIKGTKYVRAFDFDPGNQKVIHHMRLRVDQSNFSRYQDQLDPEPGFDGTMFSGDTEPDGFFLVWTPGYEATPKTANVAWTLNEGSDLVLELHLHPTGKQETVKSAIALYFQPAPPTQRMFMLQLSCETIDIAPEAKDQIVEDHHRLPADTTILALMPHAHFLANAINAWAVLPDGREKWLLRISDWDFNWQREYQYADPISLPKGTLLCMQVRYDNTSSNPRNPHSPPQRVLIGRDTFNEMAQVFFQVVATNPADAKALFDDFNRKEFNSNLRRENFLVSVGHGTSEVHFNLGCLYAKLGNAEAAIQNYRKSIALKPENIFSVNNLGSLYWRLGRHHDALSQYRRALEINPQDARVLFNLGLINLEQAHLSEAKQCFEETIKLNPELPDAWANLGLIALKQNDLPQATSYYQKALELKPDLESARNALRYLNVQLPSR